MPLPAIIAGIAPIVGKILENITGTIDKSVKDKDLAEKLKHDTTLAVMTMDHTEVINLVNQQAAIIMAEATGHSWLQRNWRPLLMLIIMIIIANNYIFFPYAKMFTDKAVMLDLPIHLWDLIKLGVGGYVVGRSGEKIVKVWKDKNNS